MKKRKTLVAIIQPEEWNQYIPFNGYISTIKKDYDYTVGVIAYNPLIFLSEADEYYTVKNGDFFSYPSLLDTSARENNSFIDKCVEQIKKDLLNDDLTFVSWQNTNICNGIIDIKDNPASVYRTAFKYAQEWYKTKKLIYPTKMVYDYIFQKYNHMFNDKTFILLSREYKNKAIIHNTKSSIQNFELMIKYLTENGIKIINIGFPPATCDIKNENYIEINDSLTQEELISLFYLSKGILTQADAGGFISHFSCNSDFFILTNQWSIAGEFENFDIISHKTKKVDTIILEDKLKLLSDINREDDFSAILKILNKHTQKMKLKFSEEKKITILK